MKNDEELKGVFPASTDEKSAFHMEVANVLMRVFRATPDGLVVFWSSYLVLDNP